MKRRNFVALIVMVLCAAFLSGCSFVPVINTQTNTNTTPAPSTNTSSDTKKKILIVYFTDDMEDDVSDSTQIKNALASGGMIVVYKKLEGFEAAFGDAYKAYGACDAEGSSYTFGSVLNYIASEGWSLVQAPSTEFNSYYYFQK